MKTRTCSKCRINKPLSDFYAYKNGPRKGTSTWECKTCHKKRVAIWRKNNQAAFADYTKKYKMKKRATMTEDEWSELQKYEHLKSKFGLTKSDYDSMVKAQKGVCAICRSPEMTKRNGKTKWLAVDHDHKTGELRGLLCQRCNIALGGFRDDPKLLEKAAKYLASTSGGIS